jgi:hypothetical protein
MLKQEFEKYLISNYPAEHAAVDINYSHATKERFDKLKKILIVDNIVSITLKLLSKDATVIEKHLVKMINDECSKPQDFINIAPAELNNKFCAARREIIKDLILQNEKKSDEIKKTIQRLDNYIGEQNQLEVIPEQFKSKIMIETHPHESLPIQNKKKIYDM